MMLPYLEVSSTAKHLQLQLQQVTQFLFYNGVAGRVTRFNYNKEVCHDETDRTGETQLIDFMDNNKVIINPS